MEMNLFDSARIQELEQLIVKYQNAYYNGEPLVSDQEFDALWDELKKLDEVAYVRFASVYRQFSDINTFMEELTQLLNKHLVQISNCQIFYLILLTRFDK